MSLTVRQKADHVATFRFVSVHLMETLARWVPTTPELEVKVLFGRHVWDLAQHADALGKRTAELRLGLQHSRRPTGPFMEVLETFAASEDTARRVGGFYHGILPILEEKYRQYLDTTDHLMDEPTVRILERILSDTARLKRERERLREDRPDMGLADDTWLRGLIDLAQNAGEIVEFRPPQQSTVEVV